MVGRAGGPPGHQGSKEIKMNVKLIQQQVEAPEGGSLYVVDASDIQYDGSKEVRVYSVALGCDLVFKHVNDVVDLEYEVLGWEFRDCEHNLRLTIIND
jgi:hypothetical protein